MLFYKNKESTTNDDIVHFIHIFVSGVVKGLEKEESFETLSP